MLLYFQKGRKGLWTGKFGKDHPAYKNGKGYNYHHVLTSIKLLGYNCEICDTDKNIDTHHKDGNKDNNPRDGSNWQRLCKSCHTTLHWKPRKKFANQQEGLRFHYNLLKVKRKKELQLAMYKQFKTYSFLRTKDLCQKMNLSRERIRQLRNEGFLNFVRIGHTFIYPPNYRKT